MQKPDWTVSIVIPFLNEEESLLPLYKQLKAVLERQVGDYELLFVDDGSTDGSRAIIEGLVKEDDRTRLIAFRTNLGKSMALAAGFQQARGDIIFTMDADLQDEPEEISRFLKAHEDGYDLVCGWRKRRLDPAPKVLLSRLFNLATRWVTGVSLHDFNCGFKSYRRELLMQLRLYGDLHRFVPVLAAWRGYRIQEVAVKHHPRRHGQSKYGIEKLIHGFLDLITVAFLTRYEKRPLHFLGGSGVLMTLIGFGINLYLTILWFLGYGPIGNRPLLFLGMLLVIVGAQFLFFGLLAEFLLHLHLRSDSRYLDDVIVFPSTKSHEKHKSAALRPD